jgi:hypothetical protein
MRYIDLGNPINKAHPLARGLVSFWLPLSNSYGGTKVYDLCGFNHGTLINGSLWAGTPYGPGLLLDGTNDYLSCGIGDGTSGASTFSITTFCAPTNVTQTLKSLTGKFASNLGWVIETGSTGVVGSTDGVLVSVTSSGTGNDYAVTPAGRLATGVWRVWTMVYDGTQTGNSNRLKLYRDGLAESLTFTGTIPASMPAAAFNLCFGEISGEGRAWAGQWAAGLLHSRAISSSEAYQIANTVYSPLSNNSFLRTWERRVIYSLPAAPSTSVIRLTYI